MSGTPRVWLRFERTTSDGKTLKLRIQDVPSEMLDEAVEFFKKHYLSADTLSAAYKRKFAAEYDDEAEQSQFDAWIPVLKKSHVVVCCSDEQPNAVGEIFAVAASLLLKRGEFDVSDFNTKLKSDVAQKILDLGMEIYSKYDPFGVFPNVNVYLDDMGISVHSQYRGLRLYEELLRTRRLQAKSLGAEMTGGWMTSTETQQAAEKDGWSTALEIPYADLAKEYQLTFDKDLRSLKFISVLQNSFTVAESQVKK